MLERKFYQNLIHWKENHEKECLLINGARQVGKTFLVEHFGAAEYASCISINFIKNPEYKAIFEGPLDPSSVIKRLSLQVSNARIVPRSTLLFLDESTDSAEVPRPGRTHRCDCLGIASGHSLQERRG